MSTPNVPVSAEQAVTNALNEQGFLFAQIVREKISNRLAGDTDTQNEWQFVTHEYPVTAVDGSQTRIDHVLRKYDFHLVLECKRANPDFKKWVFFQEAEERAVESGVFIESAFFRQRPVVPHSVNHQVHRFPMPPPCKVFNYYVESAIHREKQQWSATKTIEDAFQQVMRGHSGLMGKLMSFDSHTNPRCVPVVVTTAELIEAQFDANKISLGHGSLDSSEVKLSALEFCAVNYHADDQLAVNSAHASGSRRAIDSDLAFWQIRTVFVVHATAINSFLSWAGKNLTPLTRA